MPAVVLAPVGSLNEVSAVSMSPTARLVTALCGWLPSGAELLEVKYVHIFNELVGTVKSSDPTLTVLAPPVPVGNPIYVGEFVGKLVLARSPSARLSRRAIRRSP